MRAVDALQSMATQQGLDATSAFALSLALEECASNIVNHAYKRDSTQSFDLSIALDPNLCVMELRDRGPSFDPTTSQPRPLTEDAEPGGWGIELARRHVDEMTYQRVGDENVLRLVKRLEPPHHSPDGSLH